MRRALLSEVTLMLPILRLVVEGLVVVVVGVFCRCRRRVVVGGGSVVLLPPSSGSSQDRVLCCGGCWVVVALASLWRLYRRLFATSLVAYFSLW